MRPLLIILGLAFLVFFDIAINHGRVIGGILRMLQDLLRQVGIM